MSILCVIKRLVPDNREDDTDKEKDKSRIKSIVNAALFGAAELAVTIIGIFLMSCSSHRDECKYHVSEDKADADQCAFTADIHETRKQRHQYAGDEECIG